MSRQLFKTQSPRGPSFLFVFRGCHSEGNEWAEKWIQLKSSKICTKTVDAFCDNATPSAPSRLQV